MAQESGIFHAAARGDLDKVTEIVNAAEARGTDIIDGVDEAGRTACFYAQMNARAEVVKFLQGRGWTAMDDSNLFRTSGGRLCFWKEPTSLRRVAVHPASRPPVMPCCVKAPSSAKASNPHSSKKARALRVQARRARRDKDRAAALLRPAAASACYPRKESGRNRREHLKQLPQLETQDVFEADVIAYFARPRRAFIRRLRSGASASLTQRGQREFAAPLLPNDGFELDKADIGPEIPPIEATPPPVHNCDLALSRKWNAPAFDFESHDWPELPAKDAANLDAHTARMRQGWTVLCPREGSASDLNAIADDAALLEDHARAADSGDAQSSDGSEAHGDEFSTWVHIDADSVPRARFRILQGFGF